MWHSQLYEDKVAGNISIETFTTLAANLEAKRAEVESTLSALNQANKETETKLADINRWATLIKEKSTSIEVDGEMLEALIDRIEVGEKSETNGQPHQNVRIFYKNVGSC